MLLKEDIDRISKMSDKEIDNFLETDDYNKLSEDDKIEILRIISSKIQFNDEEKSFDDFAEEVIIQERIFDKGLDLNEDNIRKFRKELKS